MTQERFRLVHARVREQWAWAYRRGDLAGRLYWSSHLSHLEFLGSFRGFEP